FDFTVHGLHRRDHAGRHLHREVDRDVVVLGARMPVVAGLAVVFAARAARGGVDRADRHAVFVLHDADLDFIRVAATRMFAGRHLDFVTRSEACLDIAIHAFHLEAFARSYAALPREVLGGGG